MNHVLLLEEDAGLRSGLLRQLQQDGLTVTSLERKEDVLDWVADQGSGRGAQADAVLLGIQTADAEGLAVLRAIRSEPACRSIPVVLVAGQAADIDLLLALEPGADDCLARPCSLREVAARLKALLRRASFMEARSRNLRFASIEADLDRSVARADGREVDLTRREFELLAFFLRNPGRVLSRERILSQVWGLEYLGESRTIDAHVRRLRQKLGAAALHIETIVGAGYRLGGPEPAAPQSSSLAREGPST